MYYADWDYWKQRLTTDLHSAVKLSFGTDPREEGKIRSDKRNLCQDSEAMPEDQFNDRHEIAKDCLYHELKVVAADSADRGFFKVSLSEFASWALRKGWAIPQQLAEMAEHTQPISANLIFAFLNQSADTDAIAFAEMHDGRSCWARGFR